ncbi:hypothetical protein OIU74_022898 [Salix koriyanagi]|uniref:Uncharacterized protein n=1 Tax=Salix koriyanagi TaxID=2511006 RepID=A0A9Q0WLZ0_9ROSI|nr:hypothetical protein OIU74_022898 [Salix koriyanagi]
MIHELKKRLKKKHGEWTPLTQSRYNYTSLRVMSLFSFFSRRQTQENSYLLLFIGWHSSSSSRRKTSPRQRNLRKENGGCIPETEESGCVSKNKRGFLQLYSLRWPYHSHLFYSHAFPFLL